MRLRKLLERIQENIEIIHERKGDHMIYRKLGRTGLDVGVIGLGSEYIWKSSKEEAEAVISEALFHGVNYIDIFMGTPSTRENIGSALIGKRNMVYLAGHLG